MYKSHTKGYNLIYDTKNKLRDIQSRSFIHIQYTNQYYTKLCICLYKYINIQIIAI